MRTPFLTCIFDHFVRLVGFQGTQYTKEKLSWRVLVRLSLIVRHILDELWECLDSFRIDFFDRELRPVRNIRTWDILLKQALLLA